MDYNAQDKQIHIVNLAVCASLQAFEEYSSRSLNCRRDVIAAIRVKLRPYLQEIAEREYAEHAWAMSATRSLNWFWPWIKRPVWKICSPKLSLATMA